MVKLVAIKERCFVRDKDGSVFYATPQEVTEVVKLQVVFEDRTVSHITKVVALTTMVAVLDPKAIKMDLDVIATRYNQ